MTRKPVVMHLATTDMTLAWLLAPQLEAFRDAGYEVVTASADGPFVEEMTQRGIRHIAVPHLTRSKSLLSDARALSSIYRRCRQVRPDIIHTHNPKPGIYGRIMGRLARVPVVMNTVHGIYAQSSDSKKRKIVVYGAERVAAAFSDLNLIQNEEDLATLRRVHVPARKLRLLGNGVDLGYFDRSRYDADREAIRRELGFGPDDVVCGVVGRLVSEKGFREVFAAAAELHEAAPNVRWMVIGPDDDAKSDAISGDEVREAQAGSDGRLQVLGERSDMARLYAAMDLYVLASYREGFPRSAMEAAAMGLPIVATNIRGCRQVVDDEITGRFVPKRDAAALAEAVADLAGDPEARCRMGKAAHAKAVQSFDQQQVIDITLAAYEELLSAKRRTRGLAPQPSGLNAAEERPGPG